MLSDTKNYCMQICEMNVKKLFEAVPYPMKTTMYQIPRNGFEYGTKKATMAQVKQKICDLDARVVSLFGDANVTRKLNTNFDYSSFRPLFHWEN